MGTSLYMLLGVAAGVLAATPLCVLLTSGSPSMMRGLAAVAFAFALLHGAILAVRVLSRPDVLPAGTLAALAFLLSVIVALARNATGRRPR